MVGCKTILRPGLGLVMGVALLVLLAGVSPTWAQETAEAVEAAEEAEAGISDAMFTVNNLWIMIAGMLVFIMHLGFATLETGLTRSKNTVNILFKNTTIVCIGILTYALIGFSLMYPGDGWGIGGILGWAGLGVSAGEEGQTIAYADGAYTYWSDFFFQAMFAATAATIVSGAVAERIKLMPFLAFITPIVALSYPITGSWQWGGGWLAEMGFYDFAGSTLVHSVGAWAALAAVVVLGPRLGKYAKDGTVNPIPGHSLPMAAIGVFLLWFGWFGFNGGSVLSADAAGVSLVLVTTSLAAAAGGLVAAGTAYVVNKNADLTMALNGILAGLVSITAGADLMSPVDAILIGAIGGAIVVFAVLAFDKVRIDDPVGAISVHGVCGVWGTLAVGIFGAQGLIATGSPAQLGFQLVGILSIMAFTLVVAFACAIAVKALLGFRVDAAEETEGLDLGEHEMSAYPDFQRVYIKSYHAREI
ncbi:MAG: ammonium transporter [Phycisphaeraceae bacterium]